MQMIVDAALITKKSASLDYNTDSVNAAGKIWSREIVHSESGIKAAGKSQGKPYYVLASANAKGTAESAADLFKNCVASFLPDGSNYSESIADFFRAFAQVLNKSGYESGSCDLAVFAGYNDRVYLAKSGKARLFRYTEDDFFEAKPQLFPHDDEAANYGVSVYSETKPGDIFVLLSGKVGAYISESLIKAIIKNSNGDIKRIVALIASNAVKNGCDEAVSAIVLKIDANESASSIKTAAPAAFVVDTEEATEKDADDAEPETDTASDADNSYFSSQHSYYDPTDDDIEEETESTEKINRFKSRNKFSRVAVIDVCIVIAVIAVLLGVLAVKGVFGSKSGKSTKDGVNVSDLFTEADTTKKDKKDKDKETTEATTEEKTTVNKNDTTNATTNRTNTQTPTQRQQTTPTTRTPIVTQPTTQRPDVTDPPATDPPATDPPATDPVVTDPPATDPPATDPPATDPPVTRDPNIADDD